MREIRIELGKQCPQGQLFPYYDDEADLLAVSSTIEREWPFGVDVDGTLIFDIDTDRILANFDLLIPKNRWTVSPRCEIPSPTIKGCLHFSQSAITQKSFHIPTLQILTDAKAQMVFILLNPKEPRSWIALSDSCFAWTEDGKLFGLCCLLK